MRTEVLHEYSFSTRQHRGVLQELDLASQNEVRLVVVSGNPQESLRLAENPEGIPLQSLVLDQQEVAQGERLEPRGHVEVIATRLHQWRQSVHVARVAMENQVFQGHVAMDAFAHARLEVEVAMETLHGVPHHEDQFESGTQSVPHGPRNEPGDEVAGRLLHGDSPWWALRHQAAVELEASSRLLEPVEEVRFPGAEAHQGVLEEVASQRRRAALLHANHDRLWQLFGGATPRPALRPEPRTAHARQGHVETTWEACQEGTRGLAERSQ